MRKRLFGGVMAGAVTVGGLLGMGAWQSEAVPVTGSGTAEKARAQAARPDGKSVTATLFERPFGQVGQACKDSLGPAGYGYVEVSPATEHITGEQWWTSYQPVSYKVAGRLGDADAFRSMVNDCHDAGVKVVADAVINHMSAGSGTGTGGTEYTKYTYPGLYQDGDFHTCREDINDYTDRENVQDCELVGLSDLDTGSDHVRSTIAGYLGSLREMGVDGFRIDAAKHMPAEDLEAIKGRMTDPGFWISEVIHGAGEAVAPEEYTGLGDVDEFRYGAHVKSAFQGGDLGGLEDVGDGKLDSGTARTFVDNWDTERNGSTLNYKDGDLYKLANTFMLAHPYGSPNVFSGYEWSEEDAGPPSGNEDWTNMHEDPQITGMVGFRNAVGDAELSDWWSEGGALAFSRGDKGFVALNAGDAELQQSFTTSLPAGTYRNVARSSGDACEETVTVGDDGKAAATVPAGGALALHVDATA